MTRQKFDAEQFIKDKEYNEHNLPEAMAKNASLYGYYSQQYVLWKHLVDILNTQRDVAYADALIEIKESGEKVTADIAKAKAELNPDVRKYEKAAIEADKEAKQYQIAVATIDQKGKMLISHGAMLRSEFDQTGMHINLRQTTSLNKSEKEEILDRAMGKS